MIIRSILCPLLSLAAYFTYIYSFQFVAIVLLAFSFLLLYAFPNKQEEDPEYFKDIKILFRKNNLKVILTHIPYTFFIFWILHHIEFTTIIDKLITKEALGHWSMMIAMIGWSILWGYSQYIKVSGFKDSDIVDIYDSYDDPAHKNTEPQR